MSQKFKQQVLAAYKGGLASVRKQLELNKGHLKSPDLDPEQRPFVESLVSLQEHQVKTYEELIKQALGKSTAG